MELHAALEARWTEVNGASVPEHYGNAAEEYRRLRNSAAVLDLSYRGRICVLGNDRIRFLNGQVTNNIAALKPGEGCYAALVTGKAKLVSDLNIQILQDEVLLDFEPGLTESVSNWLEKYIIADDVQVVDVAPTYGLLSVQGPAASQTMQLLNLGITAPDAPMHHVHHVDPTLGDIYVVNQPRLQSSGYDLFVPNSALPALFERLLAAARETGGGVAGWKAMETVRIEAGIPRFGADMDSSNLPTEAGLESRAISYHKGCYIGQEVISRIRTYGQVAKTLRGLRLAFDLPRLPAKGHKLFKADREVGYITSAVFSPSVNTNIALGYVRREFNQTGATLTLRIDSQESDVHIVDVPFAPQTE